MLPLPLAPRKSVAGFLAGSVTGAAIAVGFWGWLGPRGNVTPMWSWAGGVGDTGVLTGWAGVGVLGLVTGLVSGVSEALGMCSPSGRSVEC